MCSSSQVLLRRFQVGNLKLDHGETIYTMEIGKSSIKLGSPTLQPEPVIVTPLVPSSLIVLCLISLVALFPEKTLWTHSWLTDLGSVGVQHFHVLQLLQTLTVAEDGCLVIASDKGFIPLFF